MSTKYRTSRYLLLDSIEARVIFRRRLVTAGKTSAFAGKVTRGFLIDALEQNCQTSCQTLLNFLNIGRNEVSYTTFLNIYQSRNLIFISRTFHQEPVKSCPCRRTFLGLIFVQFYCMSYVPGLGSFCRSF